MQHQLRNMLERKVARGALENLGGDYYFDMNQGMGGDEYLDESMYAGDLVAGARKRRKPKKRATAAQLRALAKGRAKLKKMRKGGDFIDLNDGNLYQGGKRGQKRAAKLRARRSTYGFKDPLAKAELDEIKALQNQDWLRTVGPEYSARLQKKAAIINRALAKTGLGRVGKAYNDMLDANELQMSAYRPYAQAARMAGLKPAAPGIAWPAGIDDAAYRALFNPRAVGAQYIAPGINLNPGAYAQVPNIAAMGADDAARLANYRALFDY